MDVLNSIALLPAALVRYLPTSPFHSPKGLDKSRKVAQEAAHSKGPVWVRSSGG